MKAQDSTKEQECSRKDLKLDEQQMNYLKESVQKLLQWEAYWQYDDPDDRDTYNQKTNLKVAMITFSMSRGVIVLIPTLDNSVVTFKKLMDGTISSPRSVRSGPGFAGSFEGDTLIAIAKALGNWREFISFSGRAIGEDLNSVPPIIRDSDMKSYIDANRESIRYCKMHSEITVLPLEPMAYDPLDETKQVLLRAIIDESTRIANVMFPKGANVRITVPNFNVNDAGIWVLLEKTGGEAYIIGLSLDVINQHSPVSFVGTVETRSNPKYGIPLRADSKIKREAIKFLQYRVH